MGFNIIDVKSIVKKERKDKEFDFEYRKIIHEYNLIETIVNIRKEKQMTQKELARITGVSQQAISRLELEKHIPTMDTFIKILDGLGLELNIVQKEEQNIKTSSRKDLSCGTRC